MRSVVFAAVVAGLSAILMAGTVQAGERGRGYQDQGGAHKKSDYYRNRNSARVKGYSRRAGGYSYTAEDTINTYGDSRSNYGGASTYGYEFFDRQSNAGPFDNGFFFDSGISARGGDSPYMN